MPEKFNQILKTQKEPKSFDIWKQQLSGYLSCKRNDMKCWNSLLPKLSCEIDDANCWKTKLPHIPCEENDSECWRHLLPHLPCKIQDHNCWKDIKTGYVLRDFNSHEERILQVPIREEGYDPMRNLQRRYGGMVSKENGGWVD